MSKLKSASLLLALSLTACDSSRQADHAPPPPAATSVKKANTLNIDTLLGMHGDAAKGAQVAQEKCDNCHGKTGASGRVGAPFIGGQSYEYLLRAMIAYVNGQRDHHAMKEATQGVSAQQLVDVSRYYADQTQAKWVPSTASAQSDQVPINARTIAEGKRLSKACYSCHGEDGVSQRTTIPSLAGMHAEYFVKTLNQFFSGERKHQIMAMFKESVPKQNVEYLAAYYASLKPRKSGNPIAGDAQAGRQIALAQCGGCHGTDGNSITPAMPSLAGQDAAYLVSTTRDYTNGARQDDVMTRAAKRLSDKQIADVSAYFAEQRPEPYVRVRSSITGPFTPLADATRLAKSCDGCHGPEGNSRRAGMPSLTGLTPEYLVASTLLYRSGKRPHKEMKLLLENLTELDIEKLSYYYATRETRSSNLPGKGNVAEGAKQSAVCAGCHDKQGPDADPLMPTLKGQSAAYIIQASEDYLSTKRGDNKAMRDAVAVLPKEVLVNIAAYYATQRPDKLTIRMAAAPVDLAGTCDRCHGPKGHPRETNIPRLAGQVEPYLARVLREYGTGKRTSSPMHVNAIARTHLESRAIAAYYSAQ